MQSDSYLLLKEKAIALRKQGKVYSEILSEVPVAKSTLSLWLREVGLAKKQAQRITEKRIAAQKMGARAKRTKRQKIQESIYSQCLNDIVSLSERERFLMGVALYWAEGNKEKEYRPGSGMGFSNSDPRMLRFFLNWLRSVAKIEEERIDFELYIHEVARAKTKDSVLFWSEQLHLEPGRLNKVYYKKGNPKTNRRNTGNLYYGLLRVKVCSSSDLVRRIEGWVRAVSLC
jgi:hypothetical protein